MAVPFTPDNRCKLLLRVCSHSLPLVFAQCAIVLGIGGEHARRRPIRRVAHDAHFAVTPAITGRIIPAQSPGRNSVSRQGVDHVCGIVECCRSSGVSPRLHAVSWSVVRPPNGARRGFGWFFPPADRNILLASTRARHVSEGCKRYVTVKLDRGGYGNV